MIRFTNVKGSISKFKKNQIMKKQRYCWLLYTFLVFCSCNQTQKDTSKTEQIIPKLESKMKKQKGIITKKSNNSFHDTYNSLIEIITNNPNLKIIAELNHRANAASVGLEMRPTRIVLFGNPKLGTPLMQNEQTTGLDLPQKILVWQDADQVVKISYNDPAYLQERHGITNTDKVLKKVSNALDKITSAAAGF